MSTWQALSKNPSVYRRAVRPGPTRHAAATHAARAPGLVVPPPRVAAPVRDGWHVFDARIILHFQADTKYTAFVVEGREYIISESLQALEQRLQPHGFMRVHRGALVNLFAVRAVHRQGRQTSLELISGTAVPVSRRLAPDVLGALSIDLPQSTAIPAKIVLGVPQ